MTDKVKEQKKGIAIKIKNPEDHANSQQGFETQFQY